MCAEAKPAARKIDSANFRRARARLAGYALHHKRPEIAREAGRRGGKATSERFPLGPRAWGVAMAMKRWHGKVASELGSRAPKVGTGGDGGGALEPVPVPALPTRRKHPGNGAAGAPRQGMLL